jgi:hypothetical protein
LERLILTPNHEENLKTLIVMFKNAGKLDDDYAKLLFKKLAEESLELKMHIEGATMVFDQKKF